MTDMRIYLISHSWPHHSRGPRCDQRVNEQTLSYRRPSDGDKCYSRAHYIINGKHYCKRHAGIYALKHLLDISPPEHIGANDEPAPPPHTDTS